MKASLRIGRYTDAETHALALVKEFPKEPQVRLDLAFAQRGLQKQTEARESYIAAIDADPFAPGAYQEYAEFLVNEAKQKDEAKKVLDKLIAARPRDPESYNARGRFYALLEAEAPAIADARKSLELDPQNADAMLLLGEQLQKGKDIPAAADLFRDGTKVFPGDPRFVRNLAWLEVNRGNSGLAVAALEDGMARVSEKDAFDLLVPLADLLIQMRDSERSAELLAKLEKRTETDPRRLRTTKMQVLYLQGRLAMSRSDWPESINKLTALRNDCGELLGLECQVNLLLSVAFQRSGEFDRRRR